MVVTRPVKTIRNVLYGEGGEGWEGGEREREGGRRRKQEPLLPHKLGPVQPEGDGGAGREPAQTQLCPHTVAMGPPTGQLPAGKPRRVE